MFFTITELKPSQIHGIGVFTAVDISTGAKIYRRNPELDLSLTEEQFAALDPIEQKTILHYGYVDKNGLYRLDHDDIRFVNDSNNPNIGLRSAGLIIALRDIRAGEELTQNYHDFEDRRFA